MLAKLYSEYASYPGRQIVYTVVPRKFVQFFFEGVQTANAQTNADEVTHGQFGYKSDVIVARDFKNITGTFNLKEFNNASYVLRGMSGIDPQKSFIFDASRLEHVDVAANIWDKNRTHVMRSHWIVDFMPAITENESLDEIQTKDISYTAIRKLDFEGKQIVVHSFTDTKAGDKSFTLPWKATIDPTVQTSETINTEVDVGGGKKVNKAITVGIGRHELCPIQWALRVWVDGEVLSDPGDAAITTTNDGDGRQTSVLTLKEPLSEDGQIVKVMWLAEGTDKVSTVGQTQAPVMVSTKIPTVGTDPKVFDNVAGIDVTFSSRLDESTIPLITGFVDVNNRGEFKLVVTKADGSKTFELYPSGVSIVSDVDSGNVLHLDFSGMVEMDMTGGITSGDTYESGDTAVLHYFGNHVQDPEVYVTPNHALEIPAW